ncbi:DUF3857 domain-containing protein [Pedobacter metabolipauper]|uniref:Uncharacterized protein DUF3857 n=1 Tax=Pedobacter metabolipauper TaxID=425513 RepID=A0A4R6T041_9SPHI|nr:DUF3857 domain-containing protein [Pedobacter metabolipauper]TDQ12096.1 uncharacterized protein DUF3857 [Pedobacter metabolipauper]
MKQFLLLFSILLSTVTLNAQDFEYGQITNDELALKNARPDSNANAIVTREFGTTKMKVDYDAGLQFMEFQYHVRIKIFNKNGYKHGTITIPLSVSGAGNETLINLKATTINYINGVQTKTILDNKDTFTEKSSKNQSLIKFTMPNLNEGSIIEYSYTLQSPYVFNFRGWQFQSAIPKLHSEYIAYIPATFNYNAILRGKQKLTYENAEVNKACYNVNHTVIDCSKMTYIMKDVPAFIEEAYMTAPRNFISAIHYELADHIGTDGLKTKITRSWNDLDRDLIKHQDFGQQIKKKEVFKDLIPGIIKNSETSLDKAKAIYAYIAKNIKHNFYTGIYSSGIKKSFEQHSGSTGDINISLIAALSAAGLDAEALILSTRSNGTLNNLYPILTEFDYIVAKVNIADQCYLLDASQPFLPFGLLPLECINGKGRVINLTKPSYWYDLKASQKESTNYMLNATLDADGKIKGTLTTYSSGYAALDKRIQISKSTSTDDFVEKLDERMTGMTITDHKIENLDSLDQPVIETYEIEMNAFDHMDQEQLFYNPFIISRITTNPFNLNERTYPVDLGSASESRIMINIKMPENFTLADKPQDVVISLPNSGGKYATAIALNNNFLSVSQILQMNRSMYAPEEYLSLKEFYSRIVQLQKTDILLKTK